MEIKILSDDMTLKKFLDASNAENALIVSNHFYEYYNTHARNYSASKDMWDLDLTRYTNINIILDHGIFEENSFESFLEKCNKDVCIKLYHNLECIHDFPFLAKIFPEYFI